MGKKIRKVSMVIPTFQEEEYIARTLSNVVNTKSIKEVIVVDGGSEDKTVEIARRFTDKVYQIQRRGISKARNYGAKQASGDVLIFLDADVNVPLDFVEKVIETFNDATVVGAACNILPTQPQLRETFFFRFHNLLVRIFARFKPHSRGEFLAVRRNDFLRINGFDESLPCSEDHDLAFRLSKRGRFVFIKSLTVYESLRRFRKLGFLKVVSIWLINYLSFIVRGKPVTKVWQPVR